MNLFEFFRRMFTREEKIHTRPYVVNVLIEHPQIIGGAVFTFKIGIDANSKEHARRRLRKELKIIIGRAYLLRNK